MKKFILTVGPSLLIETPISAIHSNQNLYRINGAHGTIEEVVSFILKIRAQVPTAEILIDLPGNKIRTENLEESVPVKYGEEFKLKKNQFNYAEFYKELVIGDEVWADDSTLHFKVLQIDEDNITFVSFSTGLLRKNKGFNVKGLSNKLPFLFDRDYSLIEIANDYEVDYVGLSFVRNVEDILFAKSRIDSKVKIISKVETKAAVLNLNSILEVVDYILVDRGVLSSEIGIEKIAKYQSCIVGKALFYNKKVFLATQFLKNMEQNPLPTIAEMIDLYNTFSSGIYGIQLSEETAIGKYPEKCIDVLKLVTKEIETSLIFDN